MYITQGNNFRRLLGGFRRRLIRPWKKRALILLYHRIADLEQDPQLLSVVPKRFEEHLHIIKQVARPMSLTTFVEALYRGDLPDRSVAITFDDGYIDNLTHAIPLLKKNGIPATIFVSTGYVSSSKRFWWDELEYIFFSRRKLPGRLEIEIATQSYSWEFNIQTQDSRFEDLTSKDWNVLLSKNPTLYHKAYRDLCRLMKPLGPTTQSELIKYLRVWAGMDSQGIQLSRVLEIEEIQKIDADGLVEIGAHTVNHPCLSSLSVAEQRCEILKSKFDLENWLSRPVRSFAYPYGGQDDYTRTTTRLLRESGFSFSCSNFSGIFWKYTDRFQLPRWIVRNWDGRTFEKQLSAWFEAFVFTRIGGRGDC